jgi:hypothetical protein
MPRGEPIDDVRGVDSELADGRCRKAGLEPVLAEEDHTRGAPGDLGIGEPAVRVESLLERVAGNEVSTRDGSVLQALGLRADVDEAGALGTRAVRLERSEPAQLAARVREQVGDRASPPWALLESHGGHNTRTSVPRTARRTAMNDRRHDGAAVRGPGPEGLGDALEEAEHAFGEQRGGVLAVVREATVGEQVALAGIGEQHRDLNRLAELAGGREVLVRRQ